MPTGPELSINALWTCTGARALHSTVLSAIFAFSLVPGATGSPDGSAEHGNERTRASRRLPSLDTGVTYDAPGKGVHSDNDIHPGIRMTRGELRSGRQGEPVGGDRRTGLEMLGDHLRVPSRVAKVSSDGPRPQAHIYGYEARCSRDKALQAISRSASVIWRVLMATQNRPCEFGEPACLAEAKEAGNERQETREMTTGRQHRCGGIASTAFRQIPARYLPRQSRGGRRGSLSLRCISLAKR